MPTQYDKYVMDVSSINVEEILTPLLVEGCGTRVFKEEFTKGNFLR